MTNQLFWDPQLDLGHVDSWILNDVSIELNVGLYMRRLSVHKCSLASIVPQEGREGLEETETGITK